MTKVEPTGPTFTVCNTGAPLGSIIFSPFELLYRCQPQVLVDLVKEGRENQATPEKNLTRYITELTESLEIAHWTVCENLQAVQEQQRGCND